MEAYPQRWRFTNPPRKHPRNTRVTSAEELLTMSKIGRSHENVLLDRFSSNLYCGQIIYELLFSEMKKKLGVTDFVSEIKHVEPCT